MKKLFVLCALLCTLILFACTSNTTSSSSGTTTTTTTNTTTTTTENQPTLTPVLHHWMPNSIDADVTATLDLKTATLTSIKLNEIVLEDILDYEITGQTLTIFGECLKEIANTLGVYPFKVNTSKGDLNFDVTVVSDPKGTSIPTKTIQGINMETVANYMPTEVIANAPELLITEIGGDNGFYDYIEIFNNTAAEYNLKGHRIVFANTGSQIQNGDNINDEGIFYQPNGMTGFSYIYQDLKIPALSTAYLWILSKNPWTITTDATRKLVEDADVQKHILGDKEENLSLAKFRNIHSLEESAIVLPIRTQNIVFNHTSAYDAKTGLGAPVYKVAWGGFNTSMDRGVQIQKMDSEKTFDVPENYSTAPVGAVKYRYVFEVLNCEEDLYVNGVLDPSKVVVFGKRESINAFSVKREFFNEQNESVGFDTGGSNGIDSFGNSGYKVTAQYRKMSEETITPVVSALIYGQIIADKIEKWGALTSLEYTVPTEGSHFMRFLSRGSTAEEYLASWSDRDANVLAFREKALFCGITEVASNNDIVVPESDAYQYNYIKTNTAGKTAWFNFKTSK